jgi:hypothetical protein
MSTSAGRQSRGGSEGLAQRLRSSCSGFPASYQHLRRTPAPGSVWQRTATVRGSADGIASCGSLPHSAAASTLVERAFEPIEPVVFNAGPALLGEGQCRLGVSIAGLRGTEGVEKLTRVVLNTGTELLGRLGVEPADCLGVAGEPP